MYEKLTQNLILSALIYLQFCQNYFTYFADLQQTFSHKTAVAALNWIK